jgi:hypothetical protein
MYGSNSATSWQTCDLVSNFCTYIHGDGTGGTNEEAGSAASAEECVNLVLSRFPHATGATYPMPGVTTVGSHGSSFGNTSCWAEFGGTGAVLTTTYHGDWQTCRFPSSVGVCEFEIGDGVGGTEENLGTASSTLECVSMVRVQRPAANGATFDNTGTNNGCYAEFDMTSSNGHTNWQTCAFVGGSARFVTACVFGKSHQDHWQRRMSNSFGNNWYSCRPRRWNWWE